MNDDSFTDQRSTQKVLEGNCLKKWGIVEVDLGRMGKGLRLSLNQSYD